MTIGSADQRGNTALQPVFPLSCPPRQSIQGPAWFPGLHATTPPLRRLEDGPGESLERRENLGKGDVCRASDATDERIPVLLASRVAELLGQRNRRRHQDRRPTRHGCRASGTPAAHARGRCLVTSGGPSPVVWTRSEEPGLRPAVADSDCRRPLAGLVPNRSRRHLQVLSSLCSHEDRKRPPCHRYRAATLPAREYQPPVPTLPVPDGPPLCHDGINAVRDFGVAVGA